MANRYNDRDDEQRRQSGSGRENTQGGSTDYNRDRQTGGVNQGAGGTGFQGSYSERGYDSQDRDFDDFASSSRPGNASTGDFGRNTGSDRGNTSLYGRDRDANYADRSGDQGGYAQRSDDFQNQQNQDRTYGYSGGGGSYARSYDRDQQDREHGGSSRYYGEQTGSTSYDQGQSRNDRNERSDQDYRGGQRGFYGQSSGYAGTSESGFDYNNRGQDRFPTEARSEQDKRGLWEKATDSVASVFGDKDAAARRERDGREADFSSYNQQNQQNFGSQEQRVKRGPKNYRRSDERIREDIYDRLTDQYDIDASDIEIEVQNGEVIMTGIVDSRQAKRHAEDLVEHVSGVTHLENRLRVKNQNYSSSQTQSSGGQTPLYNQNQAGFSSADTSSTSDSQSRGTFGSREDLAANYSNENLNEFSPVQKDVKGDLTGASDLTDTANSSGGANAGIASSTTGATVGSNPGTGAAGTATQHSATEGSEIPSERGVDRLSKPAKSK